MCCPNQRHVPVSSGSFASAWFHTAIFPVQPAPAPRYGKLIPYIDSEQRIDDLLSTLCGSEGVDKAVELMQVRAWLSNDKYLAFKRNLNRLLLCGPGQQNCRKQPFTVALGVGAACGRAERHGPEHTKAAGE